MLLMVNVDDVTGETVSHVINEVMTLGANNVHVVPAITKKGRPEYLFYVDAEPEQIDALGLYFARELGTIGMRVLESRHLPFDYRFETVRVAPESGQMEKTIRVKEVLDRDGTVISAKADYEDLKTVLADFRAAGLAQSLAFTAFKGMIEQTVLGRAPQCLGRFRTSIAGENDDEKNTDSIGQ